MIGINLFAWYTDCCASCAARLLSSSLYFTAALDVYLTLESLLASAADPPCV